MLRFNAACLPSATLSLSAATLSIFALAAPVALAIPAEFAAPVPTALGSPGLPAELTLSPAATAPLTLDMSSAIKQEPVTPASDKPAPTNAATKKSGFGQSDGGWWLTLGTGVAYDFESDYDFNGHIAASTFIATDFEFAVEAAGWYFDQEGPNTGGVSGSMVFRWHFCHDESYSYTIFGDAGIGLLGSFDNTPADGSSFNFLPRIGLGATFKLDDVGDRLQIGIRYHHISNARINGDGDNPARDSVMLYAGIIFPF